MPLSHPTLDRLASLQLRSRLVPVLGAGMSASRCVTWKAFVTNLEAAAGTTPPSDDDRSLVERSHRALTALRRRGADLVEVISQAMLRPRGERESADGNPTKALASLRWPLVITTNYDDLYVAATRPPKGKPGPRLQIVGRSPLDCQRVLTALHEPAEPLLWALHGYLGGVAERRPDPLPVPESELVVGHEEYRRVTHAAAHFRRAFSEVLRSRSLLFLGCGLDDPHLTGLLEETIALTGASPMPHFAVVFDEDRTSDRQWLLRSSLNIEPIVLRRFDDLPRLLEEFRARVVGRRPRISRWPVDVQSEVAGAGGAASLEIVRGPLPDRLGDRECVAVSAGRGGEAGRVRPAFSFRVQALLARLGVPRNAPMPPLETASAFRLDDFPVIVAFARTTDPRLSARDARLIAKTTEALLDVARAERFETVHAQLLAAGAWSPFPPRVALAHMLRGYARWHARTAGATRLAIHVLDEELLQELDGQRIDLLELIEHETARLWVEVSDGEGRTDRYLRHERYDLPLRKLADSCFTSSPGWIATVFPGPTRDDATVDVAEAGDLSLEDLGVLPGATIRFLRRSELPACGPRTETSGRRRAR